MRHLINKKYAQGFTLVELIIVIVILGIIAVVAAPRFLNIASDAKVAVINNLAAQIESTISLVRNKALVSGLRPIANNPGAQQSEFVVDFGFGSAEVDFRNLCPESIAEFSDRLRLADFIEISGDDIQTRIDNQYTLIGFDIPATGTPTNQGCYVIYNSFGNPKCTVTPVTVDC
jgi:MSHA pilin protein MshA